MVRLTLSPRRPSGWRRDGIRCKSLFTIKFLWGIALIMLGIHQLAKLSFLQQGMREASIDELQLTKSKQLKNGSLDQQEKLEVQKNDTTTIGFAVTFTGCGSDPITEGAAVLKHSIHLASIHGPKGGRYDYKMYAIYHPAGESCALPLKDIGYELVRRDTPVAVEDIEGDFLRKRIVINGCCGEKELVKLEAYTLTQHPVVVLMDLDTLVHKPMDALFDWMTKDDASGVPIMWPDKPRPQKVNAFFTRDYPMSRPGQKYKPVQGGFLVLRPDMTVYQEFVDIIRKGDFREGQGWGGLVGPFWGSLTFQGLIPYYYDVLHPLEAVEVNRCIYNQMAENPKDKPTVNDITYGRCLTEEEECEDCRNRDIGDVVTSHFTLCMKPWTCNPMNLNKIQQRLCRKFHHAWFQIRSDLEVSWGRDGMGSGTFQREQFYGYCSEGSQKGYIRIASPYGSSGNMSTSDN